MVKPLEQSFVIIEAVEEKLVKEIVIDEFMKLELT